MNTPQPPLPKIAAGFPALLIAAAFLAGCGTTPESFLVTSPPPRAPMAPAVAAPPEVYVVTTPAVSVAPAPVAVAAVPAGAANYVVLQAPPAPQAPQAVPARPSPDHLWIVGYWTWRNARYEWMAGHWETPPHSGAVWVNPTWTEENGAFRFFEGYWS